MVIAGFAAVAACFGSNTASADIFDDVMPLLTSSCSFDQIDAAMHVVAPDSAARLDNAPFQRGFLQSILARPAAERARIFRKIASQRRQAGATTGLELGVVPERTQVGPILKSVTDACHKY